MKPALRTSADKAADPAQNSMKYTGRCDADLSSRCRGIVSLVRSGSRKVDLMDGEATGETSWATSSTSAGAAGPVKHCLPATLSQDPPVWAHS